MKDRDCVDFLQWALPRLHMRWPGFRKVRRQVCKRVQRRLQALGLGEVDAYRDYLLGHPAEWEVLDTLTRITISRFYRDRQVFHRLASTVLPHYARAATEEGRPTVRVCSLGCASGEEPYTISLIWSLRIKAEFPDVSVSITGVDADRNLLERARRACYAHGSIKDLPDALRCAGFVATTEGLCLRPELKQPVRLVQGDVREGIPDGPYDIVLCRYLAFTYFDEALQARIAREIDDQLRAGGLLLIGGHEQLPAGHPFHLDASGRFFYWKSDR